MLLSAQMSQQLVNRNADYLRTRLISQYRNSTTPHFATDYEYLPLNVHVRCKMHKHNTLSSV